MYAILIACSIVLKLNDDRSVWNSDIPNPNPIIYGNYRSDIKNPILPTYEVTKYTYTNSQLPNDLDKIIVDKIKSIKRQQILENFIKIENIKEIEEEMMYIESVNQISINNQKNSILDDINIPLYQMLNWLNFLEWEIINISPTKNMCSQIILQKKFII